MDSDKIYHVYGLRRRRMNHGNSEQWFYIGKADIYKREYIKRDYVEEVESTRENTYPKGGVQGDHWYEYIGTK